MSTAIPRYCYICRGEQLHRLTYLAGDDLNHLECVDCGRTFEEAGHIHWLYEGRGTICGLGIGGVRDGSYIDRRFAQKGYEVTCPDCALMMVEYLAPPTTPDWRPPEAIGEDFYAG